MTIWEGLPEGDPGGRPEEVDKVRLGDHPREGAHAPQGGHPLLACTQRPTADEGITPKDTRWRQIRSSEAERPHDATATLSTGPNQGRVLHVRSVAGVATDSPGAALHAQHLLAQCAALPAPSAEQYGLMTEEQQT